MSIIFRKGAFYDIPQLEAINAELKNGSSTTGFLRQLINFAQVILAPDADVFLAEQEGEILGYSIISYTFPTDKLHCFKNCIYPLLDLTNSSKYIYSKQLAIAKNYQRQGIGSFIYQSLFEAFPHHIFLGIVLVDNQASLDFQLSQSARFAAEYWKEDKLTGYLLAKGKPLMPQQNMDNFIA